MLCSLSKTRIFKNLLVYLLVQLFYKEIPHKTVVLVEVVLVGGIRVVLYTL